MNKSVKVNLAILFLMLTTAFATHQLTPHKVVAKFSNKKFEDIIPKHIGHWREDENITPIAPDTQMEEAIKAIYSDTLSRAYLNESGQMIMLALAYGMQQTDTMRLHRPEGCYAGQGFAIQKQSNGTLMVGEKEIKVRQLLAVKQMRNEYITYWMLVGGRRVTTQFQAKIAQLMVGLSGEIPDGILVRISSIDNSAERAYKLHAQFANEWLQSQTEEVRLQFIGTTLHE